MKRIGVPSPASSTQSFTPSLVVIIDISKTLSELRGHRPAASDHGAAGGDAAVNRHHRAGDGAGLRRGQKRDEAAYFLGGGRALAGIFVEQLFPAALVADPSHPLPLPPLLPP